jgi:hypothetical protein
MRAVTFNQPGGPEVLRYEEISDPVPVLANGKLHPVIDRVFPLKAAAAAETYLASAARFGKVVLEV